MTLNQRPGVIVFDMDGVLVEVTASYRETIRETVRHFTGELISHDLIQDFKNAGGWNNDWALSHRLISDRGKHVDYQDVVAYFNRVFLGENGVGLINKEHWVPAPGLLDRLLESSALAIFTGRARNEADITLKRHAAHIPFDPIVTDESVSNPKPAPDGLRLIMQHYSGETVWYLGDTVDDARSAQAAGVPFIGVTPLHHPRHDEIAGLLRGFGAMAVIGEVNELEALIQGAQP